MKKVLIANRGEIARRVIRTLKIITVTAYVLEHVLKSSLRI